MWSARNGSSTVDGKVGVVLTFGHGTATRDGIVELLRGAGTTAVVDVRSAPGSRRNPHVARGEIERWLPEAGIDYRWDRRLGGFRKTPPNSPDVAWRNQSFRGYAVHMRTEQFAAAVDELLAEPGLPAVLCSESAWWRCHRRMIADFLRIARAAPVHHLLHDGAVREHEPMPEARLREDGLLVYDGGQNTLL